MEFDRSRRRSHIVNLTPLVDVFFLLMIFFMLTTSFVMSDSIELQLPSQGARSIVSDDVMQLMVQKDGSVKFEENQFTVNELDKVIRERLAANKEQKTLILATQGVTVQQMVTVMDLIYINGGRNVQIDHYKHGDSAAGHDVKLAE